MIKFFKKTARKIFGHHKHHDDHASLSGPITINQVPVVESSVKPAQSSPSGLGRRTKNTLREATVFAPVSDVKIEGKTTDLAPVSDVKIEEKATVLAPVTDAKIAEKAKEIALQLESVHEAKAPNIVQPEIIQKAEAFQLKHQRQPQIYEGEGKDAFGLNGALVKSPFEDEKGNKKPIGERTKIMDSLQKGELTYKLKVKPHQSRPAL